MNGLQILKLGILERNEKTFYVWCRRKNLFGFDDVELRLLLFISFKKKIIIVYEFYNWLGFKDYIFIDCYLWCTNYGGFKGVWVSENWVRIKRWSVNPMGIWWRNMVDIWWWQRMNMEWVIDDYDLVCGRRKIGGWQFCGVSIRIEQQT